MLEWGAYGAFFTLLRVRQGDPLSPYLFVLGMEKLTHIILDNVRAGVWRLVKFAKNAPGVTHLMFANDLVLFSEASMSQAKAVMDCINTFCSISGHKVNVSKSRILFSKHTRRTTKSDVGRLTNILVTTDPGKYLGFQLFFNGLGNKNFNEVLTKMSRRLASWKAKVLSMAGRATLIKSVFSSVPVYHMQLLKFPSKECSKIDKLSRNFLWNHGQMIEKSIW